MKKQIANAVTGTRILCSILMMFSSPTSVLFYVLYLLCGISDMVDGTIARKTNTTSTFGAKLDSAADFLFVAVSMIKLLPILMIPNWLWVWIFIIVSIRISNILSGFLNSRKLVCKHTFLNKVTGFFLFLMPLTPQFIDFQYSSVAVCVVATVSSVQEGYYIRTGRETI